MVDELKLKIGAADDTQKAFDSASKRANKFKDVISSFKKDGKLLPELSDKRGMDAALRKVREGFNKIHQDKKKDQNKEKIHKKNLQNMDRNFMSKKLDQAEQIGSALTTGRETEILASKIGEMGKGMMGRSGAKFEGISGKGKTGAGKEIVSAAKEFKKTVSGAASDVAKGMGGFTSTSSGGRRFTFGSPPGDSGGKKKKGMFDEASDVIMKLSQNPVFLATAFVATGAAISYKIASSMADAFRGQANQQIGNLQKIGIMKGSRSGFYEGYGDIGVSGSQRTSLMAAYGAQTMGRTGAEYTGKTREMAEVMAAYGLGAGQVGGMSGMMARYKRKGDVSGLITAVGAAEKSDMGGARLPEFLSSLETAISDAVQAGSQVGNDEIIESLTMLSRSDDERIKTLAPGIMKSASGVLRSAAGLEGGAAESFAMQAVWSQMRKESGGAPVSLMDVRARLSKGGEVGNLKAMVTEAQKLFPGNEEQATFWLQKTIPKLGAISDPYQAQKVVDLISNYDSTKKSTAGGGAEKQLMDQLGNLGFGAVEKRKEAMQPGIETTLGRAVKDGNAALLDVNKKAADKVDILKDTIQDLIFTLDQGGIKGLLKNTIFGKSNSTVTKRKG